MRATLSALLLPLAACSVISGLDDFILTQGRGGTSTEGSGANGGGGAGTGGGEGDCQSGEIMCVAQCVPIDENCGGCGRSCEGGACDGTNCMPAELNHLGAQPDSIVVDGDEVYWLDLVEHHVMTMGVHDEVASSSVLFNQGDAVHPEVTQIAILGGKVCGMANYEWLLCQAAAGTNPMEELHQESVAGIVRIAADASGLYWANLGSNEVKYIPDVGSAPVVLSTDPNPSDIAMDESMVYWTTSDHAGYRGKADTNIQNDVTMAGYRIAAADGAYCVIVQTPGAESVRCAAPAGVALLDLDLRGQTPTAVAMAGDYVYWTEMGFGSRILRASLTTEEIEAVAEVPGDLTSLAVHISPDGQRHRVFVTGSNGKVYRIVIWN